MNQPQISSPFGKISRSSLHVFQLVYKEQTLSHPTVSLWHKRCIEGREDVENDPSPGVESSLHKLCAFPDLLRLFAKCYLSLTHVHLRSVEQLTDDLHAQSSLPAQHWFHFYWWKAFHTWDHPQHPHILL